MAWLLDFNSESFNWDLRISDELINNVKNGFTCDIVGVNNVDSHCETCLIAAYNKPEICIEFIRFLLVQSADPNCAPNNGYSPLCSAIVNNRVDLVSLLIEFGANGKTGFSVLYEACRFGNLEIVQLVASVCDRDLIARYTSDGFDIIYPIEVAAKIFDY